MRRGREKGFAALAVRVGLLAALAVCFAQLLRLCAPGCRTDALLRARERAALEWNIRRGVYPAGDWDAAEFSAGGGSGRRAVGMKEGVWER